VCTVSRFYGRLAFTIRVGRLPPAARVERGRVAGVDIQAEVERVAVDEAGVAATAEAAATAAAEERGAALAERGGGAGVNVQAQVECAAVEEAGRAGAEVAAAAEAAAAAVAEATAAATIATAEAAAICGVRDGRGRGVLRGVAVAERHAAKEEQRNRQAKGHANQLGGQFRDRLYAGIHRLVSS